MYPNPNNGEFVIEIQSATTMIITDVIGKLVFEGSLDVGNNLINLNASNNGVYFVHITGSLFNSRMRMVKH